MSMMCKAGSHCAARKGLCGHERMMIGMMLIAGIAGLIYWLA